MNMKYLSLFSGIEAASQAWHPLGWQPVAFAEVEPFPNAVLAHHYPAVPNLGDVRNITDERIAALGPIDVVVGGSPCTNLSVAGKREGLAGEHSSLFYELVRIFHAARTFCNARYLLWENVPHALAIHKGRDFAAVVNALAGCRIPVPPGGWRQEGVVLGEHGLLEWSLLDAQWFGLAQRRKRLFAVLDSRNWQDRAPILLERDRLRGNCPARRKTQCFNSASSLAGADEEGGYTPDIALCLNAGSMGRRDAESETFVVHGSQDPIVSDDIAHALGRNQGLENVICMPENVFTFKTSDTGSVQSTPFNGCARKLTPRESERLQGFPDDYTRIPFRTYKSGMPRKASVATMIETIYSNAKSLSANQPDPLNDISHKECPDGLRYRALGNSMAVPVMRWIGERIDAAMKTNTVFLMEKAA